MPDGDNCSKLVGPGSIQYRCTLKPHEGPCVCNEIPSTRMVRENWLRAQAVTGVESPPPVPVAAAADPTPQPAPPTAPVETVAQDASISAGVPSPPTLFLSNEQRMAQALGSMQHDYDGLPLALKSWTQGAVAQLALVELWRVFQMAQSQGADSITLGLEDIESIIPAKLRT